MDDWRKLDEALGAVLETALDAVVVIDVSDRIIGWNHIATRTFGWSASEALGKRISELVIPQQHRDAHPRRMEPLLETGGGPGLRLAVPGSLAMARSHIVPPSLSFAARSS